MLGIGQTLRLTKPTPLRGARFLEVNDLGGTSRLYSLKTNKWSVFSVSYKSHMLNIVRQTYTVGVHRLSRHC
eukprot:6472798-Amphidinium_carterae.1